MDEAFRQHASPSRRKNHSTTNLDHLSLAPLTSRLPLSDSLDDQFDDIQYVATTRSYLEGKSAPTTPGILARNPAHPRTPLHPSAAAAASLPKKSQSATALHTMAAMGGPAVASQSKPARRSGSGSGAQTPTRHHHHHNHKLSMTAVGPTGSATDRDWLEHTGALLSDSAREYKGQGWLVGRDSSTSLTGQGREEETDNSSSKWNAEQIQSRRSSASTSRIGSRMGSRIMTPLERGLEGGYFSGVVDPSTKPLRSDQGDGDDVESEWEMGPDFVNLNERLEASAAAEAAGRVNLEEDEATIRSLVRDGNSGVSSWIGNIVGWPLFSVDEGEESDQSEAVDGDDQFSRTHNSTVHFEETVIGATITEERIPPPRKDDDGGWQDAAWLLNVASKVLV